MPSSAAEPAGLGQAAVMFPCWITNGSQGLEAVALKGGQVPGPLQKLRVRLVKSSVRRVDAVLEDAGSLNSYELRSGLGFDGRLYVAPPAQGPPDWLRFVETGIRDELKEITNRTNAAVLVIRRKKRILALTFGHGWRLLREDMLEPDFGLKTALNGLRHDGLRSLDSFSVEEQTVHKRSQTSRASGLEVFGIDISRDMLRAVTGAPRQDLPLQAISGAGGTLAVSAHTEFRGLGPLVDLLLSVYHKRTYREHFAWVDYVQRVTDLTTLADLNRTLLEDLSSDEPQSYLAPPEPLEWDSVYVFGYTGRGRDRDLDMTLASYLENIDQDSLTVDILQRHKVRAYGDDGEDPIKSWPVYKCFVFEADHGGGRFVLTAGEWFEIDRDFATRVNRVLRRVPRAEVSLPNVRRQASGRLESEPRYNRRVAEEIASMALLDTKNARCRGTTTGIEVCDLLSKDGDLIHVKHRKGGSSSLSHLFAQGRMSGEALLRDEEFRGDARRFLRKIRISWERRIPVAKPDPGDYCVVFAVLGAEEQHPGGGLPFFSQLNLVRTYEALTALGYRVGVVGVPANA